MRMEEGKISSRYFQLVYDQMYLINSNAFLRVPSNDELKLVTTTDVRFLRLFCLCLERWDFTQSMDILRSIMTALEVIWAKEHNELSIPYRLRKTLQGNYQYFDSVYSELEVKIHQSKLQIQGWCRNLLLSSLMQCKSSLINSEIQRFLLRLNYYLDEFLSAEIVPIKNHIVILNNMIHFLHESLEMVEYCSESENCIEFLNFARDFSNKAACLACLYWAREETNIEVTANELYIVFFYKMMLEFIPLAPHVTSCYFGILSSAENLQSIHVEETVASFVDFFFEHLSTTFNDDFLIVRDMLIYLFTFITDYPCQNNSEEDLIRSQTCALFREDAYLLLSFDEMKIDFSNKNMILRDFLVKIEIAYTNIRESYFAFSYSWIGPEAVKMDYLCFVLVQRALCSIEKHARWACLVRSQLQLYRMEIEFLRMSLLWFVTLDDSDEEIKSRLSSLIVSLQGIWGKEEQKGLFALDFHEIAKGKGDIADWHPLALELEGKIELSKLEIGACLLSWFHWSPRSKHSTSYKILKFIDSILQNLNAVSKCRASKIVPFKKQIETLEDKLVFLRNLLKLTENCPVTKDLGQFIWFVQSFTNVAARLTIMYWVKDANDKNVTDINIILSDMLQKIKPVTPDIARLYFETMKAIYLQGSDPILFGETASIFVDFVLEDPATVFKDDFQILRDDVIFLLTFLNDPPGGYREELFCKQIESSFWEDIYGLLSVSDSKGDFYEKKVVLSGFMMKIKIVNAKIGKLYCEFPDSSMYNLSKITSPWYLDFLIHNLKNMKERMVTDRKFVHFLKYNIIKFEEELVSLSPFFNYIFELQNELNDIWFQVVDLVHLTERVINSCIRSWFVFEHPIWYYMAYLSDVFERIKVIKTKLEKIKENNMYNVRCLPHSIAVNRTLPKQAWTSDINEVMVGFENEAKIIIDDLIRGSKSLYIVSIVGMGGLGKTTLARKVSSSVKDHFHILAFYSVSQDHNTRMLLLGILKSIKKDDESSGMTDDDLAHMLWKCLSRKKYLVVLDDIWSSSVWNEIKMSFPDDQNGSRVMFTTRFHDVADKCGRKCNSFHMRFMSKVESWELLQKKVFQNGISPPYLSNIGRRIAESCKGLPLAIVVVAGLLARKEASESSWSEIAEKLFSFLSDEGCMKILELSYNHLPEYLKPCLLYLGAFPQDKLFTVNQVIRLWIAEGFVHEYETNRVEDVAKEYFHDLVDRSLIIVSAIGASGEIKTFCVHDLIHNMCQTKCQEGNFFKLGHGLTLSSIMYDHYRISDAYVPPTINRSSSLGNASTLLLFTHQTYDSPARNKLKLAQVLYVENSNKSYESLHLTSLVNLTSVVNLRYIEYDISFTWLPSSISNLWNIQSLILNGGGGIHYLPETLWKMKSLKYVKVGECMLQFSDVHEQLDNAVSFSNPRVYSGKEVEMLLQRLPAVRKLGITLVKSFDYVDTFEFVDTLDFFRKLESLNISGEYGWCSSNLINFPSTLKKLKLVGLELPLTTISSVAELHCLRVLKLHHNSFTGPRLEMQDVVFNRLVFFELDDLKLVQWNASTESFPCLEQLSIRCDELEELPSCFGEIPTLKRISIRESLGFVGVSALQIRKEQLELGNKVEVTIKNLRTLEDIIYKGDR